MITDFATSETIEYVSNSLFAIKVAFIYEISNLFEETGADVSMVAHGMSLDKRICDKFLKAGLGFGGSCFPKDLDALFYLANQHGVDLKIVDACIKANKLQKEYIVNKVKKALNGSVTGKTIGVSGSAFKADTDYIRGSPAIDIIKNLKLRGANINVYDPLAMDNMK